MTDESTIASTSDPWDFVDFVENAAMAIHWVGPDGTILRVNQAELDSLGYERAEYEGHNIAEFHVDATTIQDILSRLTKGETIRDYPARIRAGDGSIRHVLINSNVLFEDGVFRHTRCLTRDISSERRAYGQLAVQHRVASLLGSAESIDSVAAELLESIGEWLDWQAGAIWLRKRDSLICLATWTAPGDELARFAQVSAGRAFAMGEGLPGRVWADGDSAWIRDVGDDGNFLRIEAARDAGLHGAFAVPIKDTEFHGIIECFSCEKRAPESDLLQAMELVARQVAQCIERHARENRIRESSDFLSRASLVLASSLELEVILQNLAELVVPAFADSCHLVLLDKDGGGLPIASVWADPDMRDLASRARQHADPGVRKQFEAVLRDGNSIFMPDATAQMKRYVQNPDYGRTLDDFGMRSLIMAPMRARERTLGVAVFITAESGRTYDAHDRRTAEDLAERAAWAVDNARLFHEVETHSAELTQALTAKDEFLAMVSHELRTPVTMISGAAYVLDGRAAAMEPDTLAAVTADLKGQAARLSQMVENLLALARAELAEDAATEPILVRRLAQEVLIAFRRDNPGRQIELELTGQSTPALGDSRFLELVLHNFLANAHKYSPAGLPVTIAVWPEQNEVLLAVRDQGPGVDASELDRVFERFYRSPKTAQKAHGAGMGLAVSKRLIEAMGGRIWAASRPEGGLEVGFALPAMDAGSIDE